MKRAAALLLAILLLLSPGVSARASGVPLLKNGGFENLTSAGEAEGWYPLAYRSQAGYSRIAVTDEKAHSGRYSAVVTNASSNDARYTCTVRVKPSSMYRLSGYVLVDHMEDTGNGANFGIEGIYAFSDCLFDTNGEWEYLEWYGETGEDQTELTFGVRVGGYSAESTGKAYFDDIVLEEVEELPSEIIADIWYDGYHGSSGSASNSNASESSGKSTLLFVVLALLFAAVFYFIRPLLDEKNQKLSPFVFVGLMIAAPLLRIALSIGVAGYEVDINCFKAWSMRMAQNGPAGFYSPDYFCDYPPGAMLLLWPIGHLLSTVGSQNAEVSLLIVKLLPVLCDLLGGLLLYICARKRMGDWAACALAALYLLNPAVLVNGAAWGQMDSVLALLVLLTTIFASDKKWRYAIPLFAVSALVKPQALLFAPLGGMWLIFDILSQRKKSQKRNTFREILWGIVLAAACSLVIVLPFSIRQSWDWLIKLYASTLSSYAYATLNTANLYYLIGANWMALDQLVPAWLPVCAAVLLAASGVLLHLPGVKKRICQNDQKAVFVSILFCGMAAVQLFMAIFGVTYAVYGYAMMAFVYLFAILCLFYDRRAASLPLCMAIALAGVYVLGVKVHERYLFPALLLMLLCYVLSRDRRVLLLLVGFSVTTFVNTAIVLDNSILFGAAQGHLNSDTLLLNNLLCVINLALFGLGVWLGVNGLRASKPLFSESAAASDPSVPDSYVKMLTRPKDHRLHLRWLDYVIIAVTTLAYSFLAFVNLGSTTAPQTAWVSTSAEEQVVFELEEKERFSVLYYAGVSHNDFSIQVSDDGVNWSKIYPCQMREGLCYRWNYAVNSSTTLDGETTYSGNSPSNILWLEGKYLRVNADDAGLNLWEIVASRQNGELIPLQLVSHTGEQLDLLDETKPASHLIDEADAFAGEPGWFNGTYFDEIYHARTGYEHLHGIAPYETTHPPLGKLLMSAGIAIFGMTPFGWRFAGALVGVLMLPALYLLALQLTHKRSAAVLSMVALSLDLMHFTQTRIATIDSFPVFFILLSYFFMVRYMQMDAFADEGDPEPKLFGKAYLKTLLPLLFSGICMGLSIASKWIGLYSAVGLAVLFFLTIYRHYCAANAAWDLDVRGADAHNHPRLLIAQRFTLQRILITCGFCVLFFVLIPGLIYCLSYIPYLAPTGPVTLKRIMAAQEGMLSYHSTPGLGMDHPFQSPWWQWPFILKPMWFAQDAYEPAGFASTIMCMGNPWIFYIGAFAMAAVILCTIVRYVRLDHGKLSLRQGNGDLTLIILVIAFMAQYLPWVLVPRSMYIYHYFASVPFIILATAWLMEQLPERMPALKYSVMALYVLGALLFFVMFFPYASGRLTSVEWLEAMKWFPRLYY